MSSFTMQLWKKSLDQQLIKLLSIILISHLYSEDKQTFPICKTLRAHLVSEQPHR